MGTEAAGWANEDEVLSPLVTAYIRAADRTDTRAPILYAGNAVESFLSQVGTHFAVNLVGAHGINAKVERLTPPGHLKTKQSFMFKYLGHIRNGADHGIDPEIGSTWEISPETAIEYVHVAMTAIRSVVLSISGNHIL
jgi:hypothetical protein